MFIYRLAKYIGSMTVAAGGLDALVFTGGIGENSDIIRERVLGYLGFLGLHIDQEANLKARFGNAGVIIYCRQQSCCRCDSYQRRIDDCTRYCPSERPVIHHH